MADNSVTVSLRLRDELSKGMRLARVELDKLGKSATDSGTRAGRASTQHDALDRTFRRLSSSGSRLFGVLRTGALSLAAFTGAQGLAGLGAATLAINLVETSQKFDQVFGPAAARAGQYVKATHDRFGVFTGDLKDSLATFGDLGRSIGLSGNQLADFSTEFVNAGLDISSFKNIPINDVFQGFQSGLAGEQEALRRFGIFINEKMVDDYAKQVMHLTGTLSEQQKTQARAGLILDQFNKSAAKGDLARTQNSPANQLRQFTGRLKEMGAIVGGVALAPLGVLLPNVNKFLARSEKSIQRWQDGVKKRGETLGPALSANFKRGNLAGVSSNLVDILGGPDSLKQPLEDILVLFRDFARIVKTDLIPAGKDIAAVLIPALDAVRRFFDVLPPGTVRRLLEAFLAWKVISTIAGPVNVATAALLRLAGAQAAASAATAVGPEVAVGNAGAQALGLGAGVLPVAGPLLATAYLAPRATFQQGGGGDPSFGTALPLFGPASKVKVAPPKKHKRSGPLGWLARHMVIGDTASPRRYMLDAGQYVTSGYRTFGVGNDSDHAAGRAFDIAGPGLLGLAARISRDGGYAAMHGIGASRHLHAVPAGDTASPRRQMAMAGVGGDNVQISVQVFNPSSDVDVTRAIEQAMAERDRKKQRRSPSG